jgi:hypothetical protein
MFRLQSVDILRELQTSQMDTAYIAINHKYMIKMLGSSVGIETELRVGRSGDGIPVGRDFPPLQTGPWAHPASCKMGTGSSSGVKSGRGVTLTPHSLLAPWSWKGRAIPLLPLWAVRPVQSLSACTRVHFTFKQIGTFPIFNCPDYL